MYHRLENSIIDVIKEEQAKLGYRKEEIRLYYPLSSLDHFFETEADAEEMKKILTGFGAYTKEYVLLQNLFLHWYHLLTQISTALGCHRC